MGQVSKVPSAVIESAWDKTCNCQSEENTRHPGFSSRMLFPSRYRSSIEVFVKVAGSSSREHQFSGKSPENLDQVRLLLNYDFLDKHSFKVNSRDVDCLAYCILRTKFRDKDIWAISAGEFIKEVSSPRTARGFKHGFVTAF